MFFPLAVFSNSKHLSLLKRLLFVFGVVVFKLLLDYYYHVYGPLFSYLGMAYLPQSEMVYLGSFVLLIFTAFFLPLDYSKPSNIFLSLLYIMSFVPICSVYSLDHMASTFGLLAYGLFIFGLSLILRVDFPVLSVKSKTLKPSSFNTVFVAILGFSMVILVLKYGFSLNLSNYTEIYDVREMFKEETGGSRFYTFVFNWLSHVFSILLLLISLIKRNVLLFFVSIFIQLYLFNLGGNKAIFLLPFFAIFLFVAIAVFKEFAAVFVLYALVFLVGALYFYDFVINESFSTASSILVRRNFFVPANLYFDYIHYFSYNPKDFMAGSFPFSMFAETYYTTPVPLTIGTEYVSRFGKTYANGNFLSDLFFNFGWLGYLLGFFLFSFILKIMDSVSKGKNIFIVVPLFSIPVISLMNSALMVNLISYGLILTILLFLVYPKVRFYKILEK